MTTWRSSQKADRRARLLAEAAALFARRGFAGVTTVEIGESVGMSGPALYKHFASKDAILAELLVGASERLLAGGREIVAAATPLDGSRARTALDELIDFHIGFAIDAPDIIRIQDRELAGLDAETNHRVRRLQREYVEAWDLVLDVAHPGLGAAERRTRLLGVFGLLNSTPHSASASGDDAARILADMARRALGGSGSFSRPPAGTA
ncbi:MULTISPECIES: TetR/AcrR family transcriptional regulator [unclassified Microbacterium]|uniref:TetR/AcrR family transcriptional regulator n=1 Tax=unclassified Microbacterium TaxID=2609290 RepID=UPI00301823AE